MGLRAIEHVLTPSFDCRPSSRLMVILWLIIIKLVLVSSLWCDPTLCTHYFNSTIISLVAEKLCQIKGKLFVLAGAPAQYN